MLKRVLSLLLFVALLLPTAVFANKSWDGVVDQVENYVKQSLQAYRQGDVAKAKEMLNEAYFGPFESDRMEQAIRTGISAKRAAEIEFQFNAIRKKMSGGEAAAQVEREAEALLDMLRTDANILEKDQSGAAGLWLYSLLIIVREGVEAILVIAAVAAYLVKSGNEGKLKEVYGSALAAVLASLATAWLFRAILQISGSAQEVLEGVTLILSCVILVSMSYWMFGKADARRWKHYIEGKVQDSVGSGKRFALMAAVFLAVYREGAETVLFYQALLADSPGGAGAVWTGLAVGAAALVVLFFLIRLGSARLPLKPFFLASGALLYLLAFVFAGEGVKELQESGLVASSAAGGFATIGFLGIYPTWEGLGAQAVLLALPLLAALKRLIGKKSGLHKSV